MSETIIKWRPMDELADAGLDPDKRVIIAYQNGGISSVDAGWILGQPGPKRTGWAPMPDNIPTEPVQPEYEEREFTTHAVIDALDSVYDLRHYCPDLAQRATIHQKVDCCNGGETKIVVRWRK